MRWRKAPNRGRGKEEFVSCEIYVDKVCKGKVTIFCQIKEANTSLCVFLIYV